MNKVRISPLLKDSIVLLAAKRGMLRKNRESIKHLVVGSSHGDFGFNPAFCPQSFNLCCRSQDMKHSFFLYRKMLGSMPNIENLILFYSMFSPGFIMELNPASKDICPALNEIFKLDIEYDDAHLKLLSQVMKGRLDHVEIDIPGHAGFLPDAGKGYFSKKYGADKRAQDHIKYLQQDGAQKYLGELLSLAQSVSQKVYVVIPPVRSDYKKAIAENGTFLHEKLLKLVDESGVSGMVTILNYMNSSDFPDEYFGDYDHLLTKGKGVEVLSSSICNAVHKSP